MNQIPNIEETYNTREVEEVVKEFYKIFDTDNLWQGEDEWTKNVPIGNIEQWLRTTLLSQQQKHREELQKAREEALEREKQLKQVHMMELDAISCMSLEQYVAWRDYRKQRPHHSELDQDKK